MGVPPLESWQATQLSWLPAQHRLKLISYLIILTALMSFRFYCIDFDLPNLVISIKEPVPLKRATKQWGHRRIAVEGELVKDGASFCYLAYVLLISGLV